MKTLTSERWAGGEARQRPEVGRQLRAFFPQEIRGISEEDRTIEFVASTETTDRYGDIIRVAGWKTDNYMRNPVFLWGHRSGDPPIGKCVGITREANPPALVQKIQFADKATYPFADTVFNLYRGGYMRAVSVGFMPLEQPNTIRDEKNDRVTGYEFTSQELLELSAVPVPANQEALARAVSKGVVTADEVKAFESAIVKCGEKNPPWSYMAPGVTYAAACDDEPEKPADDDEDKSAAPGSVRSVLSRIIETRKTVDSLSKSVAQGADVADALARIGELRKILGDQVAVLAAIRESSATHEEVKEVSARSEEIRQRLDKLAAECAKASGHSDVVTRIDEVRSRADKIIGAAVKKSDLAEVATQVGAAKSVIDNVLSFSAKSAEVKDVAARVEEVKSRVEAVGEAMVQRAALSGLHALVEQVRASVEGMRTAVALEASVGDAAMALGEMRKRFEDLAATAATMEYVDSQVEKVEGLCGDVKALAAKLDALDKFIREQAGKAAEDRTVCPYVDDPVAPKGTAWDARAEMAKQAAPAGWKRMATVVVGDPALKDSYKLPHHQGAGFKVVPNGVRAALARLEQTQMPSVDRAGARSHLMKHQKKIQAQTGAEVDLDAFEAKLARLGDLYRAAEDANTAFPQPVLAELVIGMDKQIEAHVATLDPQPRKAEKISTAGELEKALVKN